MRSSLKLLIQIPFILGIFAVFVLIPAVSLLDPAIVPREKELQQSDGIISLRSGGRRSGGVTILTRVDGQIEEFSCRVYLGGSWHCIHPKYKGKQGEVYWFWANTPFGGRYKFPVRITVEGRVVRDRQLALNSIKSSRVIILFLHAPISLLIICVAILIDSRMEKA